MKWEFYILDGPLFTKNPEDHVDQSGERAVCHYDTAGTKSQAECEKQYRGKLGIPMDLGIPYLSGESQIPYAYWKIAVFKILQHFVRNSEIRRN